MNYPEPILQPVGGTDESYRIAEDFLHPTSVGTVTVRTGFVTDGASLPINLGWSHWDAVTAAAAVLHDGLYASQLVARSDADRVLREVMLLHGCSHFRAWVYWCAVRSFGWAAWNKATEESVEAARKMVSVDGSNPMSRRWIGGLTLRLA